MGTMQYNPPPLLQYLHMDSPSSMRVLDIQHRNAKLSICMLTRTSSARINCSALFGPHKVCVAALHSKSKNANGYSIFVPWFATQEERAQKLWNILATQAGCVSTFTASVEARTTKALRFCARPTKQNYLVVDINRRLFRFVNVQASRMHLKRFLEALCPTDKVHASVAQLRLHITMLRLRAIPHPIVLSDEFLQEAHSKVTQLHNCVDLGGKMWLLNEQFIIESREYGLMPGLVEKFVEPYMID